MQRIEKQKHQDQKAYSLAKQYLLQLKVKGITSDLIEKYLHLSETKPRPDSLSGIYKRMLETAQGANMKAGVIGRAVGGVHRLALVLCDFQPDAVIRKYQTGWEQVLNKIEKHLKPNGKIRRAPNSIWPRYCQTILSAATFISQFTTANEFYEWADSLEQNERSRPALPMLLSYEVEGFGFALACDFLKDLGYVNFAKPDVHIKDIFEALSLCPIRANNYQVFKAVVRVAKNVDVTPYDVDKLFWLIGSGNFYDDKQIGIQGKIGGRKKDFIAYAKQRLKV